VLCSFTFAVQYLAAFKATLGSKRGQHVQPRNYHSRWQLKSNQAEGL